MSHHDYTKLKGLEKKNEGETLEYIDLFLKMH